MRLALYFNYTENLATAEDAVVRSNLNRFVGLIMGNQTSLAEFLYISIAIKDEDTNLTFLYSIALLYEHLVTVVEVGSILSPLIGIT